MFCGQCGSKIKEGDVFCAGCGKRQSLENQSSLSQQSENQSSLNQQSELQSSLNQQPKITPVLEGNQQDAFAQTNTKAKGSKKKAIGIIVGICVLLVLLVGIGLFFILRTSYVEVPDLRDLTEAQAVELIEELGLTVGDIAEEYSRGDDEGLVISQSPRAGSERERGTAVSLVISLGTEPIEVPDFIDLSLSEATDLIGRLGLELGVVAEEYSETSPEGFVISQSIRAGSRVEQGERVDLVVSLGVESDPDTVTVPDFIGLYFWEAFQLIHTENLGLGLFKEEFAEDVEEGYVINQSLRAGDVVDPGTVIDLVISLGAPPPPPPPPTPSVSPFNLDVWGADQVVTLELDGVTVDVPIPPWLNDVIEESLYDEDFIFDDRVRGFISDGYYLYIMNRERDDLKTMIEVHLLLSFDDFEEDVVFLLHFIESSLNDFEYNASVSSTIFYQGRGELTAGITMFEYPEEGSDEMISTFELLKINEYNGILILTRLRLRTVDAPDNICSDEFVDAFGLQRYVDGGFISMDP